MLNKIDLDILHKHAFGETGGRQSGRTFYSCSLIVGSAELGQDVVVILRSFNELGYVKRMIKVILKQHDVIIREEYKTKWILINGAVIKFHSKNEPEGRLLGYNTDRTAFVEILN